MISLPCATSSARQSRLCDEVGDPITRWLALCWLGEVAAWTGDYTNARALFEQVLHKGVAAEGDLARHWAIPDLGSLLLSLGDVVGATSILDSARVDFDDEVPWIRILFLLIYGRLLLASGDDRAASASSKRPAKRRPKSGTGH